MALQSGATAGAYGGGKILSASQAVGRNTNSIMANWIDRTPWQYWDTITLLSATVMAQTYSIFSAPIGAQDPLTNLVKNKLQTNIRKGNQFPPPNCLLLGNLGFYFESTMLKADIDLILQNYYCEFKIDEKTFHEGYLEQFPSGMGLAGTSTRNGESVYTNGYPAPGYARNYGDWSKYIAPEQFFSCILYWQPSQVLTSALGTASLTPPTLTNGGTIRVVMNGLTDRSVQ
jgi:hypothetical protein